MGIHGLTKVIADHAPRAIKETPINQYFGRKVAIDASMSIYQFMIAVRSEGGQVLMNATGETTSHLMGIFYRTIRMMENGIKPIYVFDGKPPALKSSELDKRLERRKEATQDDQESVEKFQRRTVKVTKQHNDECKKLLTLMGIPVIEAPGEAEAQCAELVKSGHAFGTGSEDMDTLTFGSPILLRHLTFSEARKMPISEIHLEEALKGLQMTMEQFVDLCILLGCDYCETIKGVGPQKAVKLIQEHSSMEQVLKNIDSKKYPVPEDWPHEQAKRLFLSPEVVPSSELEHLIKWTPPQEDLIVQFLVQEKGFNEDRVRNGIRKMTNVSRSGTQGRIDSFFTKKPASQKENLVKQDDRASKKIKKK